MAGQQLKGMSRLIAAWHNSRAGLRDIWRTEEAFRLEVMALVPAVPLALWIAQGVFQAAILIASILFVILVEALNSAIEATIDRIGPEHHDLSRIAKDLGSLAVLIAVLIAGLLWGAALIS